MVMSYSGALKTWLYAGLFQFFEPNLWSVRIPVLLMGMATIALTWVWLRRLAGPRAAALAALLLGTDAMFLITNTFDWGPVALQHLFLMSGLVAFDSWLRTSRLKFLALAALLWGLGFWDKAVLAWPLGGLALAALIVYPRETLRRVRPKPLAVAAAGFFIGVSPLLTYNIATHGRTATENAHFDFGELRGKAAVLNRTLDGSALFGYMVYGRDQFEVQPRNIVGRIARRVALIAGERRHNLMLPACIAALLAFLVLRTRLLLFLLITMVVAWVQMAFNKNTGGSAHHAILLWPFPAAFVAIAFDGLAARIPKYGSPAFAAVAVILGCANLLNTNEYLRDFACYGASGGWTDALYRLAGSVGKQDQASWYGLVDWGYLNGLLVIYEGDLPVFVVQTPAEGTTSSAAERTELSGQIGHSDFLYIQHTADKQLFPGVNGRLRAFAADLGFTEKPERIIHDRNGRPVFELFRFQKAP
jgi:4-amino-4-deoxy-L-arabinose transferase-like glycosyltransferase